ncbi:TrmB family transcriptional regulator sugar-binding domain-containing protein [Halobacillus halophilus]|uniref:TrmB family transcriptional regulator sugar-binding domain-containing protein n=1 Tax=Halobacillus halophilus TaxID=1570 RepID=UPI001CD33C99|nr:TrmB family transcriptional regulator sugar-binding domain-containing protein [Halobacillus halophilus]MCA1011746.1 hypothetical protein [Halobacillus halophilus]
MTNTVPVKYCEEKVSNLDSVLTNVWRKYLDLDPASQYQSIKNLVLNQMREAEELVCISSSDRLPKEILQEIPKLAKRGVRIYLLLNAYEEIYNEFIHNKALVRVDVEVAGLMVLVDPRADLETKSGCLFGYNGLSIENGLDYSVVMNGSQIKEAFHYFVYNFWKAPEEYRGRDGSSSAGLRAPFDTYPLIEPDTFFFNDMEKRYLSRKVEELIIEAKSSIHIALSSHKEYKELFQLVAKKSDRGVKVSFYTDLKEDHLFIKDLSEFNNIKIYSMENLNNFFVMIDERKGLLLSGSILDTNEISISLSPAETQSLIHRLRNNRGKFWEYKSTTTLGSLESDKVIFEHFNKKMEEEKINESLVVDYDEIIVDRLRDYFETTVKPTFTAEKQLARTVIHRWKLVPKVLDSKAKVDTLYDQWEKETTKLKTHLEKVLEYANTVSKERKDILTSLLGRFFQRDNHKESEHVKKELEAALTAINLGVFEWSEVSRLLVTIDSYTSDLLEEQLELHEKQDYHKKKEEWQSEKERLEKEKNQLGYALSQTQKKVSELTSEMEQVSPEAEAEIEELDTEIDRCVLKQMEMEEEHGDIIVAAASEKKVLELCSYLNDNINSFSTLKKSLRKKNVYFEKTIKPYLVSQLEKAGQSQLSIFEEIMSKSKINESKENMKYVMKELATHSGLRVNLTEEQQQIFKQYEEVSDRIEEFSKEKEAIHKESLHGKIEVKSLLIEKEKELKKLESEWKSYGDKLEKIGREFSYTPKQKDLKLPFSSITFKLPEEKLPLTGTLYRLGKKRKLAIKEEKHLDLAEFEAERLKAELVLEI